MTAITAARPTREANPVLALAALEARRSLLHPAFLVAAALTVLRWATTDLSHEAWGGSQYSEFVGLAPVVLYLGTFVVGVASGHRDRFKDDTPLAIATPVDVADRTLARLLGGLSLVGAAAVLQLVALAIVATRGGIAVVDAQVFPRPTDLVLMLALVVLASASGIASSQFVGSRAVLFVVGPAVIFLTTATGWMFGGRIDLLPAVVYNPQELRLGPVWRSAWGRSDWVVPPEEAGDVWRRLSFESAAVAWHTVWVIGLTVLLWAAAGRAHGPSRRVRITAAVGVTLAVTGGVLQFWARNGVYG